MRAVISLLVAATLLTGCASWKAKGAYDRSVWVHTDRLVVYRNLGTALRLRGTYLSDTFRGAIADERQRLLGLSDVSHDTFLARLKDEGSAYHEVIFTAETNVQYEQLKFGESDESWRIRMLADGQEQKLVTVFKVKEPNPLQMSLYPHYNGWNELWVARFERSVEAPKEVRFLVGSGHGNGQLLWTGSALE